MAAAACMNAPAYTSAAATAPPRAATRGTTLSAARAAAGTVAAIRSNAPIAKSAVGTAPPHSATCEMMSCVARAAPRTDNAAATNRLAPIPCAVSTRRHVRHRRRASAYLDYCEVVAIISLPRERCRWLLRFTRCFPRKIV